MATDPSMLAWRMPWTEEPGGLQSTGSQGVRHDRSDLAHRHSRAAGKAAEMIKKVTTVCHRATLCTLFKRNVVGVLGSLNSK